MVTAAQQNPEVSDEFAARRRRQLFVAIPFILLVFATILANLLGGQLFGVSAVTWVGVALVCVLGFFIFSLKNWRCPACGRYLGQNMFTKFCAKCGAQLSP
jgi:uncharacterized protein YqgC (DUF456 family)